VPPLERAGIAARAAVVAERGSARPDRGAQDPPQMAMQLRHRRAGEVGGAREGVDPRRPQDLVDVDVAETGDHRLIEQQRLHAAATAEPAAELGEGDPERVRAERARARAVAGARGARGSGSGAAVHPDAAEPPRIADAQLVVAARERDPQVRVAPERCPARRQGDAAAHAEVQDHHARRREVQREPLPVPLDARHAPPDEVRRRRGGRRHDVVRTRHVHGGERRADEVAREVARDRLDLRQLRHAAIVARTRRPANARGARP